MSADVTKLKVIITGATGMVGEGVLLECLEHPAIEQVLIVNRHPYSAKHPKLEALDSCYAGQTGSRERSLLGSESIAQTTEMNDSVAVLLRLSKGECTIITVIRYSGFAR